ncbi:MAG: FIST N-terminal domain-containing protein [Pirellulaceae bacterium]
MTKQKFHSELIQSGDWSSELSLAVSRILAGLGQAPDLTCLFISPHFQDDAEAIIAQLDEELGSINTIGCTGESIVGVRTEVESLPAISVWAAALPDSSITPMRLTFERTIGGGEIHGWAEKALESWGDESTLLLLGEPFSFPADVLLAEINEKQPGRSVIGGMASGFFSPGENRVFLNRDVYSTGAVGVLLQGAIKVESVVSQGCRPIGEPLVITKCERNVIQQLRGEPALKHVHDIYEASATHEQAAMQQGLNLGRVIDEYKDDFEQGDFLVRNIENVVPDEGSIVVTDFVRAGQTVQFHLRDAEAADGEMKQLLAKKRDSTTAQPTAGLLFTCNGRGSRMFETLHHDATVINEVIGEVPLAGFFAMGEIGPIGGMNFVHGFTASIALFFDPADTE